MMLIAPLFAAWPGFPQSNIFMGCLPGHVPSPAVSSFQILFKMKRVFIALLGLSAIAFYSFRSVSGKYTDVLTSLGIPPSMAQDLLSNSFIGGYFSLPGNQAYKSYPAGKRAGAVQQIGTFTKNYLSSAEFQKRYAGHCQRLLPEAPKTMEARVQDLVGEYKKQVKQNEEFLSQAAEADKATIKENIGAIKAMIAIYENRNDPQHKIYMDILKMGYDGDMKRYKEQTAGLDKKFPKDVKQFIKGRLEEFLQLTADIDFNAELVDAGRKKKFANPKYEAKPAAWKYCFRAGKETIDAARAFAQQWLKEL